MILTLLEIHLTKLNNKKNKDWTNNLKDILDQANQLIEANKYEHPTITLVTTLHKPVGELNTYVRIGYVPQTIFWHTQGQV